MCGRLGLLTLLLSAALAPTIAAQPARIGAPAPLYLPPPVVHPQGLNYGGSQFVPRPLGYHVVPSYGGLGYGPFGDRTGYAGSIYSTYRGSYLNPAPLPPLILETPGNLSLRPGKLPALGVLFPGAPPASPVPRMPDPVPPGPVVPGGEGK